MKPPSAPPFPPLNNANQPKRSCEKYRGNHIISTCPDNQKCSPSQRFDVVSKRNFCSNCLSDNHKKQNCPSTKRCQICSGYHHTTLHVPGKLIKRPPAAFATSNSTGSKDTNQKNQSVKQQCEPASNNNASISSKPHKSRYGHSFANKNQTQFQRANLNDANQNFRANHLQSTPKEWFEQLQLIPVSFLNGKKAFDTYVLIDPGSQFTFILDKMTELLALPCEDQEATTLQYLNTEHDMPHSKISEQVTVEPYKNLDQKGQITTFYSTPCSNVAPANTFELNQLCDAFKELRHIHFPEIAEGKIGALLGIKTFAFTYPVEVIPATKNQPFGVTTRLGWP